MLRATIKLISRKFDQDFSDFPDNLDNWHATRNALQLGPPEINNKYYFYGLLDCTAQITCFIGMETLLSGLYERLQDFVLTVDVRAFRWKAVSKMACNSIKGLVLMILLARGTFVLQGRSNIGQKQAAETRRWPY